MSFQKRDKKDTGLSEKTISEIQKALEDFTEINQAILYGSRAKGNFRNGSDIDLTLIGDDDLSTDTVLKLGTALDDLYLPYTFDLSIYDQIENSNFKDHIDRVGVIFYDRNTE